MDRDTFCEQLLQVMEHKDHWAWPAFNQGLVRADLLHIHLEQEYATYVRDFPVLVGWGYVQCDVPEVRRALAENLYEEETGGLVAGRPHPELFLEYPRGLNMDLSRFARVQLLPAARAYRDVLDHAAQRCGWEVSVGVSTLFIEGTRDERGELDKRAAKRQAPPLEDHPLVKYYGLPLERLALTKAHRQVEGDHRKAAWDSILKHVAPGARQAVVAAMQQTLAHWLLYRDAVAGACGLVRGGDGKPGRASPP